MTILDILVPTLEDSVKDPDDLVEWANTEKTLSDGSKIKHIGSYLPHKIEGEFFWDWQGGKHKVDEFEWENGRYLL